MKVPVPIIDAETKRLQYRVMSEYKYIIMSYQRGWSYQIQRESGAISELGRKHKSLHIPNLHLI